MKKKLEVFDILNIVLMILMMIIMIFPLWYSIVGSFNEGQDFIKGGVYIWPREFTLANYQAVFKDPTIVSSLLITAAKSIVGTFTSLFVTALAAYALSRKQLKFRNFYMGFMMLTMYFGGGLIPYFMLIKNMGLYDNFWVYVIPGLFSVWNMIIIRSFFVELPQSLIESAKIDGASEYRVFFQIVLPLSKAVLAAITLFSLVGHWNSYFDSMMYTSSKELQTIQLFLRKIITDAGTAQGVASQAAQMIPESAKKITPQTIKLAAMVVTALPIVFVYPFLQKHFAKGVMIGSVKG